jgi:hypothetical protein
MMKTVIIGRITQKCAAHNLSDHLLYDSAPDTGHITFGGILYHMIYQGLKIDIISYLISLSKK